MKLYSQIITYCFISLLLGCNTHLSKVPNSENLITYNLIISPSNDDPSYFKDDEKIGKVLLAPDEQQQVFKIKTIVYNTFKTTGYQLFVEGESNYKLLDYNTSYFCIGNAKDPKAIKIRLRIDKDQFITAKLGEIESFGSKENLQIAGPELFVK